METLSALLAICSPVNSDFPAKRPVTHMSFDVFFDLRLNKRLSQTVKPSNINTICGIWPNVARCYKPLTTKAANGVLVIPTPCPKAFNFIALLRLPQVISFSACSWWRHQLEIFFVLLTLFEREFTSHQWIHLTKARDAVLWCFLWSAPKQTVE